MTSGQFTTVPISSVWVDREARQRKELRDVPSLADSIRRLGLIHPPVITRDFELKAGERRLEAVRSLGWTSLPVQFVDDLDPTELLLLELEENTKRLDITWQENCASVHKYHELRLAKDPAWTATRTAEALGESASTISEKLMVSREMSHGLVKQAPRLSIAINTAKRVIERRREAAIQSIAPKLVHTAPFLNADFREWLGNYSGPAFNFLHCDFPYGIDFHKHDRQNAIRIGDTYDDSPDTYRALVGSLASIPVADSAHLLFWFSMVHYSWTLEALTLQGWRVDPFPLIWSKGNAGLLPDPQRGPRRVYETAFMASRGDRKIVQVATNHVAFWTEERRHQSEKPKEVLKHFFKLFVDEYTVMLDPTCGSGNAVIVAEEMGASHALGIEKQTEFYEQAVVGYTKSM